MQKILIILMLLLTVSAVYAKDPKETIEYWADLSKKEYAEREIKKCLDPNNPTQLYFIVPVDSKQWKICCAIYAAYNSRTLEQAFEDMKESKKYYESKK